MPAGLCISKFPRTVPVWICFLWAIDGLSMGFDSIDGLSMGFEAIDGLSMGTVPVLMGY